MNRELGLKEQMRIQLAGAVGLMAFGLSVVFICAGLELYQRIALLLGVWNEPTLVNGLLWGYGLFFMAAFIGGAVRWWLIYRWVATGGQ